jgi:hypothetical protein
MNYEGTGQVTVRTANSLSLAYALGYHAVRVNQRVMLWQNIYRYGEIRRKYVGNTGNLYRWLEQRHDIELVDEIQSDTKTY